MPCNTPFPTNAIAGYLIIAAGPVAEHPTLSSPRRTIAVVGCDRAAGGEEVSERDGDPTGQVGALLRATRHTRLDLAINFSEDDIDRAENDDCIGDFVAEAHVFEDGQVDEARGSNVVAIGLRRAVAD